MNIPYGVDQWWITCLHYALWGELGVDYIFAFCYMGRIKGGLHF